ncbi:MAG: hypothetical protein HY303_10115 [Candidatus Wallbacteria bacterium]|nr:hypothetical protein [Candidatus Wallbacteria bacterium]
MSKRLLWALLAIALATALSRIGRRPGPRLPTQRHVVAGAVDLTSSPTMARLFERFGPDPGGRITELQWRKYLPWSVDEPLDLDRDGQIDLGEFSASFLRVNSAGSADPVVFLQHDLNVCQTLIDAGQQPQALAACRDAVAKYAGCAQAWSKLGRVLEKDGRLEEARNAHARAVELAPGDVETREPWIWFLLRHSTMPAVRVALAELRLVMLARKVQEPPGPGRIAAVRRLVDILFSIVIYLRDTAHDPRLARELRDWGLTNLDGDSPLAAIPMEGEPSKWDREQALTTAQNLAKQRGESFALDCFQARMLAESGQAAEAERMFRQALALPAAESEKQEALARLYLLLCENGAAARAAPLLRDRLLAPVASVADARILGRLLLGASNPRLVVEQLRVIATAGAGNPGHWLVLAELLDAANDPAGRRRALEAALAQCGSRAELARQIRVLSSLEGAAR